MTVRNLKQIGLAMFSYHDVHKMFPPAYISSEEGKPLLSWRVAILPYLEGNDLYDRFRRDEPWDSEHNKKLIAEMPQVYRSPSSVAPPGTTVYLTIRGNDTVFPGKDGIAFNQIPDGSSYTVTAVEASDARAVPWTKPDDLPYNEQDPMAGLLSRPDGFWALFADGSVHFISASIGADTLKLLFTRNDRKPLDRSKWVRGR